MNKANNDMPSKAETELIKRFFEPRKEFIEETRILFISRIGKEKVNAFFVFKPFFKYAFATALIVIFLSSGLVIYADSANVGATNPLYGFKKTGENVRIAVAPKGRKAMVCHQIAQRRIEEMDDFKNANEKVIKSLNQDYKEKMALSMDELAKFNNERAEEFKELCAKLAQTMAKKVEVVKAADIDQFVSNQYKEHCGQLILAK